MRRRALFLLAVVLELWGVAPAWAGGGVFIRVGPKTVSRNLIVVSPPANVVVVKPPAGLTVVLPTAPVLVVPPAVRSSAVIVLRQPCDIPARRFWRSDFPGQAFLIVGATPGNAEVFLDGRFLDSAGALVARAVPISPGPHSLEIISPGFQPFRARFSARATFPARLRVALVPQ